jgi:hypothetical protein
MVPLAALLVPLESPGWGVEWINSHQCTSWPFCPPDGLRFFIRRQMGLITVDLFLLLTTVLSFFLVPGRFSWTRPHTYLPCSLSYSHKYCTNLVATPLWPSVGVNPNTSKVGDLESSGTPECLELNNKAQNTLHWGVLGVIGKVLKRKYRKWPRIGHLDIYSSSYGQKKGRESNWQFDSRPLKVGNRPLPNLRIESVIHRWKDLNEGYKFGWDLVTIRSGSRELWAPKVPRLHPGQFRDNIGTPTWETREKEPFGCSLRGALQRILYGGRWWLPPSPGRGVSCGPKYPWLVPTPKGVPECELTTLWFVLMQIQAWSTKPSS